MTDERTGSGGASAEIGSIVAPGADFGGDLRGTIRIAPAVLIDLIEVTVKEVPGVVGFQPRRRMDRLLPRPAFAETSPEGSASSFEARGVRVTVDGDRIDADVTVVVEGQVNILSLSHQVQREVASAVERMLGMRVGEINVFVASIDEPPGEP